MSKAIISGIQQMGIGVPNVQEVWAWYRKCFGMDVRVFEEAAEAPLMTRYTGGVVHSRTATLALNMNGGGGFEIWQFTSRPTEKAAFSIQLGDYGLYMCKLKSRNIEATYAHLQQQNATLLSPICSTPEGKKHFILEDPNGNLFEVVEGLGWFGKTGFAGQSGGVAGAVIAVSSIEKAMRLYADLLGYSEVVYDVQAAFDCYSKLPAGEKKVRRVLLRHPEARKGPFSPLLGPTEIELIQALERDDARPMFEGRFWGDWGLIHLCFDVQRMEALKLACEEAGFPFTVDSGATFDMGDAGGRFSYIEDPDGTWIEFVETHKVPVMKKWGWFIHLGKRNPEKPLPRWMLKAMGLNRVK